MKCFATEWEPKTKIIKNILYLVWNRGGQRDQRKLYSKQIMLVLDTNFSWHLTLPLTFLYLFLLVQWPLKSDNLDSNVKHACLAIMSTRTVKGSWNRRWAIRVWVLKEWIGSPGPNSPSSSPSSIHLKLIHRLLLVASDGRETRATGTLEFFFF